MKDSHTYFVSTVLAAAGAIGVYAAAYYMGRQAGIDSQIARAIHLDNAEEHARRVILAISEHAGAFIFNEPDQGHAQWASLQKWDDACHRLLLELYAGPIAFDKGLVMELENAATSIQAGRVNEIDYPARAVGADPEKYPRDTLDEPMREARLEGVGQVRELVRKIRVKAREALKEAWVHGS